MYTTQEKIPKRVTGSTVFLVASSSCVLSTITIGKTIGLVPITIFDGTTAVDGTTILVLASTVAVVTHTVDFKFAKGIFVSQGNASDDITYGFHNQP